MCAPPPLRVFTVCEVCLCPLYDDKISQKFFVLQDDEAISFLQQMNMINETSCSLKQFELLYFECSVLCFMKVSASVQREDEYFSLTHGKSILNHGSR